MIEHTLTAAQAAGESQEQKFANGAGNWEPITNAPQYVYGHDALVGQWVVGRWKKVSIWEPEWTRDDCIRRGATHWWPQLPLLPAPPELYI